MSYTFNRLLTGVSFAEADARTRKALGESGFGILTETGDTLPYNLFVPKDYDPSKSYPLVNFMHDAGATSENPLFTLKQGLGAIVWASPEDQARHPCFVLAPQFAEIIAE